MRTNAPMGDKYFQKERAMRKYLEEFMAECEYPCDAARELLAAFDKLNSACRDDFFALVSEYEHSYDVDYLAALDSIRELSYRADIHEYTGALLLFLCYTRALRRYYREAHISDSIFLDSMLDLRYKLDECLCVYGIAGSFVAKWFAGFFKLERFALGRLQFEIIPFGAEYDIAGIHLTPETKVINVHIPRTGERLDHGRVLASYAMARDFYRPMLGDNVAFVCTSWLLFPRHREILNDGSNLLLFMNDYEIISSGEYNGYGEVWRLFDRMYDGDVDHLPMDSSLRRAYAELIRNGEKTGWGRGLLILEKDKPR